MLRCVMDEGAVTLRDRKGRFTTSSLRIGSEYYKLLLTQRLYDTVLTATKSEKMNSVTAANRSEKLICRLMIHGIRL